MLIEKIKIIITIFGQQIEINFPNPRQYFKHKGMDNCQEIRKIFIKSVMMMFDWISHSKHSK